MKSRYIIALDAGTGGGRCSIIDENGNLIASSYKNWEYFTPG